MVGNYIYLLMNNSLKDLVAEHFKPIFQAYDKDHNSTLEKEELRNLLADNLGVTAQEISQDQLDWHFQKIDLNGDGKITFEEYVTVALPSTPTSSARELRTPSRRRRQVTTKTSSLTWKSFAS